MFISPWEHRPQKELKKPQSFCDVHHVIKIFVGHITAGDAQKALDFDLQHVLYCRSTSASRRPASFKFRQCLKAPFTLAHTLSHHRVLVKSESNINSHHHQRLITFTKRFMSSGESRGEEPCRMRNSLCQAILKDIKVYKIFLNMFMDSHWFPLPCLTLTGPNTYLLAYIINALHHV